MFTWEGAFIMNNMVFDIHSLQKTYKLHLNFHIHSSSFIHCFIHQFIITIQIIQLHVGLVHMF